MKKNFSYLFALLALTHALGCANNTSQDVDSLAKQTSCTPIPSQYLSSPYQLCSEEAGYIEIGGQDSLVPGTWFPQGPNQYSFQPNVGGDTRARVDDPANSELNVCLTNVSGFGDASIRVTTGNEYTIGSYGKRRVVAVCPFTGYVGWERTRRPGIDFTHIAHVSQ